jgi:predicted ATP-dependent endonuclease of OLD family
MEEPELHLNPILQKKLVRYLKENTSNQYFITTHSAALMDTSDAEIYHVTLIDNESIINRATSDKDKSSVCENLGYHPSDLLLTNSIIWVEGPSDRIYINYWIKAIDPTLIEGIHYSIMFYGGRLASHISANELDESIEGLISLIRLNRKAAIVIDSDYENSRSRPNKTKQRLKKEFSEKGVSWITKGREIENYIKPDKIKKAIDSIHPSYSLNSKLGQFDNCLSIKTKGRKSKQASKVKVAEYIVSNFCAELDVLDLKSKMNELIKFIRSANQTM